MNVCEDGLSEAKFAVARLDTGVMKFYRSPLDSGGFEYARTHDDAFRVDYFDDELRVWIACESLHDEIFDDDDGMWTRCSKHEGEDAAEAWPGTAFHFSRVVV